MQIFLIFASRMAGVGIDLAALERPSMGVCSPSIRPVGKFRQVISDLIPLRLRSDEDVHRRFDTGLVDQSSHRDMHVRAPTHDGKEQRAALSAVGVVGSIFVAKDQQTIATLDQLQTRPLKAR